MRYHLTGRFIECCNCKVVCPCWVDDTPSEDHCAGFFAWSFDPGSRIDGHDVGDRHVVVVTLHSDPARGGTSESVTFVDDRLAAAPAAALMDAFSMDDEDRDDPLGDLRAVLGYPVARQRARVRVEEVSEELEDAVQSASGRGGRALRRLRRADYPRDGFAVTVSLTGPGDQPQPVVRTRLFPEHFDDRSEPLTLNQTALDTELGVTSDVRAHRTEELVLRVAALTGAGTEIYGRSGMVGEFAYLHSTDATDAPHPWQRLAGTTAE